MRSTDLTLAESADETLLERIAAGSEHALSEFYRRYEGRVYGFAFMRVQNAADAAEVLNEVMMEVWRNAASFGGRSKATTWLLGITNHKAIDLLRRRGRHDADCLEEDWAPESADPGPKSVVGAQDAGNVRKCIERLSADHRQVVYLTFFEECSYPEIARTLEVPEGTVKTRMFHARKLLARCLEKLGVTL